MRPAAGSSTPVSRPASSTPGSSRRRCSCPARARRVWRNGARRQGAMLVPWGGRRECQEPKLLARPRYQGGAGGEQRGLGTQTLFRQTLLGSRDFRRGPDVVDHIGEDSVQVAGGTPPDRLSDLLDRRLTVERVLDSEAVDLVVRHENDF